MAAGLIDDNALAARALACASVKHMFGVIGILVADSSSPPCWSAGQQLHQRRLRCSQHHLTLLLPADAIGAVGFPLRAAIPRPPLRPPSQLPPELAWMAFPLPARQPPTPPTLHPAPPVSPDQLPLPQLPFHSSSPHRRSFLSSVAARISVLTPIGSGRHSPERQRPDQPTQGSGLPL